MTGEFLSSLSLLIPMSPVNEDPLLWDDFDGLYLFPDFAPAPTRPYDLAII